ncbi:hypothetical protein HK102_013101 [Quaeritorhiza haematococci]|nr:hypothetical protein HK102_013101 [Quaeritorhiza haematococci]
MTEHPLAIVDVHGPLPVDDENGQCMKAVVAAFASRAFYILVHVTPESLQDDGQARSLMEVLKKGFTEYRSDSRHIDMPMIDFVLWDSDDYDQEAFEVIAGQLEQLLQELSEIVRALWGIDRTTSSSSEDTIEPNVITHLSSSDAIGSEIRRRYETMKTGVAEDRWTLLLPPMQDFYALYQKVGKAYGLPTKFYKQQFLEHEDFLQPIEVRISQYFDKVLGMSSVSGAAHQWSLIFKASQIDTEIADLQQFRLGGSMQQWRPKNCRSEADVINAITEKRQKLNQLQYNDDASTLLKCFADVLKKCDLVIMREFEQLLAAHFERSQIQFPPGSDLSIDMSACWREMIVLSKVDDGHFLEKTFGLMVEELEKAFAKWVSGGEPIQFMSGKSWFLDIDFLRKVFSNLSGPKADLTSSVFVIGQQSTGKSTLINSLFGCRFAVSGGRCTRGLYLSYRCTEYEGKLVHLILNDSEGLSSVEKQAADNAAANKNGQTTNSSPATGMEDVGAQSFAGSGTFDRIMTLLALTVSRIVLINHKGELNTGITNTLDVCIYHMKSVQMQTANIKPNLVFVLRDIAQSDGGLKPAAVYEHIDQHLRKLASMPENPGERLLSIAEDSVHLMTAAYNTESDHPNLGHRIVSPNRVFGEEVAVVRANIVKAAFERSEQAANQHSVNSFTSLAGYVALLHAVMNVIIANAKYLYLPNHALIGQCRGSVAIARDLQKELETKMSELRQTFMGEIDADKRYYSSEFESSAQNVLDGLKAVFQGKVDGNWDSIAIDEGEKILRSTWDFQRRLIADKLAVYCQDKDVERWRNEATKRIEERLQQYLKENEGGAGDDLGEELKKNAILAFDDEWRNIGEKTQAFIDNIYSGEQDIMSLVIELFNMAIKGFVASSTHSRTNEIVTTTEKENVSAKMIFETKFFKLLSENSVLLKYGNTGGSNPGDLRQAYEQFILNRPSEKEIRERLRVVAATYNDEVHSNILCGEALKPDKALVEDWLIKLCRRLFKEMSAMDVVAVVERYGALIDSVHHDLRRKVVEAYVKKCTTWSQEQSSKSKATKKRLREAFIGIAMATNDKMRGSRFAEHIYKQIESLTNKIVDFAVADLETCLEEWKDPEMATKSAYKASFGVLDYQNIKSFIVNPEKHIESSFDVKFNAETNKSAEKWTNVVVELHRRFSDKVSSILSSTLQEQTVSNKVTQELSEKLATEFNTIIQSRSELTAVPPISSSYIAGIFGVVDIMNVGEFVTLAEEHFKTLRAGSNFTKATVRGRMESAIQRKKQELRKRAVGCKARCPFCGAKCSHPGKEDDDHIHQAGQHFFGAFLGWSSVRLEENGEFVKGTRLTSCSEAKFMTSNWFTSKDSKDTLPLQEYVEARYPRWSPWPAMGYVDESEEVRTLRTIWIHEREWFLKRTNQKDLTPAHWHEEYKTTFGA